ncbi:T9SS type A sorting domain-containing protein [Brumimicrobium aurantiacum]|nr:T9SS type A sorting domain-containing protein [Brumimicrobium aurantiacum]
MFIFSSSFTYGQNLFPNPDFEEHTAVSGVNGIIYGDCTGWDCIAGPADYLNTEDYGPGDPGFGNYAEGVPSSGTGLVGMDFLPNDAYCNGSLQRESIKGDLIASLEKCTKYTVTFDVRIDNGGSILSTGFGSECIDFGFYFYNGSDPTGCGYTHTCGEWGVKPQVSIPTSLIPFKEYASFSIDFTASDNYDKVAFGAFYNALTNTQKCIEPMSNQGSNAIYLNLDNISLTKSIEPNVIIDNESICEGDCIELIEKKKDSVNSWEWNIPGASTTGNSEDSVIYCFDKEGVYDIELITNGNCGSDTLTLKNSIFVHPKYDAFKLDSSIVLCSEKLFELDESNSNLNYEWSDNVVGHYRKFNEEGNYVLTISDNFGCYKENTHTNIKFLENLSLYPNPTIDSWNFGDPLFLPNKIELFDQAGKIIYSELNVDKVSISGKELQLSTGNYLLRVSNSICEQTYKLVFISQ